MSSCLEHLYELCIFVEPATEAAKGGAIPAADPRSPAKGVNLAADLGSDPKLAQRQARARAWGKRKSKRP